MADTGAPHFIPYVEPSDLVRDYPAADEAQAEAVADALDAIPVLAGIGSNVVHTVKTNVFSTASTSYTNVTGLSATITPTSASSKILIIAHVNISTTVFQGAHWRVDGGNASTYVGDASGSITRSAGSTGEAQANFASQIGIQGQTAPIVDNPGTTSPVVYTVQMLTSGGTAFLNRAGQEGNNAANGRTASSITLIEVAA